MQNYHENLAKAIVRDYTGGWERYLPEVVKALEKLIDENEID